MTTYTGSNYRITDKPYSNMNIPDLPRHNPPPQFPWLLVSVALCVIALLGCASTDSTQAPPVGPAATRANLDLLKYDSVTVVAFDVEAGKGIDPLCGTKFAADIFGRLKHDFGNLFSEVRFGNPEGKTNELLVTGLIKNFSEGNLSGFLLPGIPGGKAKLAADLVLRDGGTGQTLYTGEVSKLWGFEEFMLGPKTVDRKQLEAAAAVANTIARGRGWRPSGQPSPASK